jgi:Catalytic LigB subunit of aromatic ring-opening dioxygenase
MGEILGIGCPHGPHLRFTDETMANNYFRINLKNKRTPAAFKDANNWPAKMREEWGNDEGISAARRHREEVLAGFRAARAALDDFNPDFVLMFGDDQYENFHEDILPPFCVYAFDEFELGLKKGKPRYDIGPNGILDTGITNVGIPMARPAIQSKIKGSKKVGTFLAGELIKRNFDVGWSSKFHHSNSLGHAFTFTLDYLDWDRRGFPYPVIPFQVNCYGQDMRMPALGASEWIGRLPDRSQVEKKLAEGESLPPPAPLPSRCYDLGKAVAEIVKDTPYRACIIGTSSWSHASLTDLHGFLWADVDSDREHYEQLKAGLQHQWRDLDSDKLRASGQHEMRNWVCLAGAMEGRQAKVLAYAETYIFNSCKCVALFQSEPNKNRAENEQHATTERTIQT